MEYNSSREALIISEYGRNVQKMLQHIMSFEDREKRSKAAHILLNTMASLHQNTKDYADYKQKLWDHLHAISEYKLDIDGPFPMPDKEEGFSPEGLSYKKTQDLRFRYYGRNLEQMIRNTVELDDSEAKTYLVGLIANTMKKLYLTWNKDTVKDEVIKEHLSVLSNDKLHLKENFVFEDMSDILRNKYKAKRNNQKNNQKNKKNKYRRRN